MVQGYEAQAMRQGCVARLHGNATRHNASLVEGGTHPTLHGSGVIGQRHGCLSLQWAGGQAPVVVVVRLAMRGICGHQGQV